MSARYGFGSAVHGVVLRGPAEDAEVLLGLRINTGYGDGTWAFVAGHQERFELPHQALAGELEEEAGIVVPRFNSLAIVPPDLEIQHIKDCGASLPPDQRFRHYAERFYVIRDWEGQVTNREPDKCGGLQFFPVKALPPNMMPLAAHAMSCLRADPPIRHSAFGWDQDDFIKMRSSLCLRAP